MIFINNNIKRLKSPQSFDKIELQSDYNSLKREYNQQVLALYIIQGLLTYYLTKCFPVLACVFCVWCVFVYVCALVVAADVAVAAAAGV